MQIISSSDEYSIGGRAYFALQSRRIVECQQNGKLEASPYFMSRATVKRLMAEKPRTDMGIKYHIIMTVSDDFSSFEAAAWRSGQMAKIGCMKFRGTEYRKLRKWALAK